MPFLSPLRYPGSKRRLVAYVEKTLIMNGLRPSLYIEPFAGGANVALELLQRGLVERVILADIDPWIASFWQTVFWDTEWLIEKIKKNPITLDEWKKIKELKPQSVRQQAWTCLFLNRTSFSGILRPEVGPLGGKAQTSPYKINCRFPRQTLIKRIRQIATFRDKVCAVWNLSWEDTFARIAEKQRRDKLPADSVFYYLDPPFFEKAEALYRYYFTKSDHERLRDALLNMEQKWLLSYDSAEQVETLYGPAIASSINGAKKSAVEILYSLSKLKERKRGKEIILSNLEILPDFDG
ncbi:MAG: DNA adenine methylase [Candidatus Diapherotrites archaeon]|nr:DNA adenine methylase [Candidatus Diapherotrites archaeon]